MKKLNAIISSPRDIMFYKNEYIAEDAAQKFDVLRTKTICESLSELGNVSSPHESIIVPEMYLHFTNLLLHNNKSLRFEAWASKHINL